MRKYVNADDRALQKLMVDLGVLDQRTTETKASPRRPISAKKRLDVMVRDNFACQLCGRPFQPDLPVAKSGDGALDELMIQLKLAQHEVVLEIDHKIPVSEGGTNDMDNLQTVCRDCNRGKGARLLGRKSPS